MCPNKIVIKFFEIYFIRIHDFMNIVQWKQI